MKLCLLVFLKISIGLTGNHYVTAPLSVATRDTRKEETLMATLPPLIEMPLLGGGAQNAIKLFTRSTDAPKCIEKPCPPCPAPAPPTVYKCPEVQCPKVECVITNEPEVQDTAQDNTEVDLEKEERKMRARFARRHKRQTSQITSIVQLNNKCNDDRLRQIMIQSISSNIVVAKVTIAERAAHEIGGQFDVICTTGIFSYYVAAKMFCEEERAGTTCFAFRHDNLGREPGNNRPFQREDDAEIFERIVDTELKHVGHRPSGPMPARIEDAAVEDKFESESNSWVRTTETPRLFTEPKEFSLLDAQSQNLREETFDELVDHNEKRKKNT